MPDIENVLDTIRDIECPVDQWEAKVVEAYKEYANDDEYEITLERDETLDDGSVKAFCIHTDNPQSEEIVVLVSEGSEGYVANVEDAYVR